MSVLVDVVVMKDMDLLVNRLNEFNMPGDLFNQTIHDNCERRGHFENGEFVYEFGSKEEEMGYCLYPARLQGPADPCPVRRHAVEQPPQLVRAVRRPLHRLLRGQPEQPGRQLGRGEHPVLQASCATCASVDSEPAAHHRSRVTITGIVAAALVVHGFGMKLSGRMDGGARLREDPQVGRQASRPGDRHLRRPGRRRPGSRRRAAAEERRTP